MNRRDQPGRPVDRRVVERRSANGGQPVKNNLNDPNRIEEPHRIPNLHSAPAFSRPLGHPPRGAGPVSLKVLPSERPNDLKHQAEPMDVDGPQPEGELVAVVPARFADVAGIARIAAIQAQVPARPRAKDESAEQGDQAATTFSAAAALSRAARSRKRSTSDSTAARSR